MRTANKILLPAALIVLTAFVANHASAGVLDGHPDAFSGFTGSASYSNGPLNGTVDYAVFTTADFIANFGTVESGSPPVLPHAPLGPLVYTYQINNTGADAISAQIVGISAPSIGQSDIGFFDLGGTEVSPSANIFDTGGNAVWLFSAPNILTGEVSTGLAFSSIYAPVPGAAVEVDGGLTAIAAGVPTPGPDLIPEPSSILLSLLGVFSALTGIRLRQR